MQLKRPTKTKLGKDNRVTIPAEFRKKLGWKPGDGLLLILEEGQVRVTTTAQVVRHVQSVARKHVPEGRLISEELIEERKRGAANG